MTQTRVWRRQVLVLAVVLASCLPLVVWLVPGSLPLPLATLDRPIFPPTPRPRGLRIVLIGDSLTRYSYLSLAYFLRWGRWYDPTFRTPHLVQPSSFDNPWHNQTWGEHSWQTNRMLHPLELCDCHRKLPGRLLPNKAVNNRYFYDPLLDNSLVYLDAKGHKGSLHGRITAQNVSHLLHQQRQQQSKLLSPPMDSLQRPFAWVHSSWSDALQNYVAHLDPPPTLVVMNAGLWPNNFLFQPELVDDLIRALRQIPAQGMWKTTTYGKGGKIHHSSIPDTDRLLCDRLDGCWNLSWTKEIPDRWYWDDKHFYEPVYRIMNEDLLEQIGALPDGYVKLDRNVLWERKRGDP